VAGIRWVQTSVYRDHVSVHADFKHHTAATGANVLADQRVVGTHGHVANVFGFGVVCHTEAQRIVRVEHSRVPRDLDDDTLDLSQLFDRLDPFQAEVIGLNVEAGTHIGMPQAHPGPEQSSAGRFEHGYINERIGQHHAGCDRPGHVALDRPLAVDVHPIG